MHMIYQGNHGDNIKNLLQQASGNGQIQRNQEWWEIGSFDKIMHKIMVLQ